LQGELAGLVVCVFGYVPFMLGWWAGSWVGVVVVWLQLVSLVGAEAGLQVSLSALIVGVVHGMGYGGWLARAVLLSERSVLLLGLFIVFWCGLVGFL
jgi:hypothetical protein